MLGVGGGLTKQCFNDTMFSNFTTDGRTDGEGEEQVKLNPEHHQGHLHAEEGEDRVTFSVWISELIFSRAKSHILSLSLTASN